MKKVDLVKQISEETGIGTVEARKVIESFMDITKKTLLSGNELTLRGFGTFKGKLRAEKKARNISKGTFIIIKSHYLPSFKPAMEFKDELAKVEVK